MVTKIYYVEDDQTIAFAASELKRVIGKMDSRREIAVGRMTRRGEYAGYWLGTCKALGVAGPEVENASLDDGYHIDAHGAAGVIAGVNARSVLIAVYRYLRELGCAWIRPGEAGEIIPALPLDDQAVCLHESASYRHRGVCIEGSVNYDHVAEMLKWMPKIGLNAYFNQFWTPYSFYDHWYRHNDNPELAPEPVALEEVEGFVRDQMRVIEKESLMYHAAGHGWTCAPYGLDSNGWYPLKGELPEEMKDALALVNGKRELNNGIPTNTNLCYTNPAVKKKLADAITQYCVAHRELDYVHFWLADAMNNQCECDKCKESRPADHYVDILNLVDEQLTAAGAETRVVFLIYFDLMWSPLKARLKNPKRFVLMFAPISRTYSSSYAEAEESCEVLPFAYNKLSLPQSVGENIAFLRQWQQVYQGDSFIYDYHLWRDDVLDSGYAQTAEVLFKDMGYLKSLGLNGMISCQSQRVFFPSPLPMLLMADALWNREADYETCVRRHYADAYGKLAPQVRAYLEKLSLLMNSPYMRHERENRSEAALTGFQQAEELVGSFQPVIESGLRDEDLQTPAVHRSIAVLKAHAEVCLRLARTLQFKASGKTDAMKAAWQETVSCAQKLERDFNDVFDVPVFLSVVGESVLHDAEPARAQSE